MRTISLAFPRLLFSKSLPFPSQIFRHSDKCRLLCTTGRIRIYETESDKNSEYELRKLALGISDSIDVETYVRSLEGKLIKVSTLEEATRQSSLAELLRQRTSMRKEYEWYKQCMKERIIMPYFQYVAHLCYSLVKELVDKAIKGSKNKSINDRKLNNCR